jgi:DNA end-binding protein Ku
MWKGSISFGLVNIPVKLYAATEDKGVKMTMLHEKCGTPIKYAKSCPHCDKEVGPDEIIKAYEYEPGHYVPVKKEELESLKEQTIKAIEILDFVNLSDIDPIYFNKSYFIGPNETGTKAFSLLKRALNDSKKIGMARLLLHSKEHLAVVRVYEKGLLLETIHYPDEVRDIDFVPGIDQLGEVNEKELKTAIQLIDQLTTPFEPESYNDTYREALYDLIQKKISGTNIKAPKRVQIQENAADLLSALQASLDKSKPKPPKSTKKKPAAKKTVPKTKQTKKASS